MIRNTTKFNKREKYLGYVILLALVGIGIGIFLSQFRYNPAILTVQSSQFNRSEQIQASEPDFSSLLVSLPKNIASLTPPETFELQNLSDKIDGKAGLYLSSGFVRLQCQRFSEIGHPDKWMEFFAYDMGNDINAFSVFSSQKRSGVKAIGITRFSYITENALFFAYGFYYVEIIASVTTEKTFEAMRKIAKNYINENQLKTESISEIAMFPKHNLDEDSISLIISDAFGFDRLDHVFTAIYRTNDTEAIAFLSHRKTPQEASQLAQSYYEFLLTYDGKSMESSVQIKDARMVEIMDTYELVFTNGPFLAGVHEATSREQAEKLAHILSQRLEEVAGGK